MNEDDYLIEEEGSEGKKAKKYSKVRLTIDDVSLLMYYQSKSYIFIFLFAVSFLFQTCLFYFLISLLSDSDCQAKA